MIDIIKRPIVRFKYIKTLLKIRMAKRAGMIVGNNFNCSGNPNFGSEPYLIKIGNHVGLSFEVTFVTHDGSTWVFRDMNESTKTLTKYGSIEIFDNCFIGGRVTILPHVKIGPNSIVAAGAVVSHSIPENTVCAGIPARPIMPLSDYIKKCKKLNQRIDPKNKKSELLLAMEKNLL